MDYFRDTELRADTLHDIRDFSNEALKGTVKRISMLQDASLEEPHIKLLIIDMVNFYLGLLPADDRRTFILDLYEQ